MKAIIVGIFIIVGATSALAQDPTGKYTDSPTSQWFQSLQVGIPGVGVFNCCDQADCRATLATEQADGSWVADSKIWPGEKVIVPKDHIVTDQGNPLSTAIICEANGGRSDFFVKTIPSAKDEVIYCFVPAVQGF